MINAVRMPVAMPDGKFRPSAAMQGERLPFYLAAEEWLARKCRGDYFMMWSVKPTVIFGRNQDPTAELDIDYCRSHGIEFYRRKSGGGCVYADGNNLMFSYITDCDDVVTTFSAFTGRVAAMLSCLGIADASANGRNDILIAGRKVSGYAFYFLRLPDGRQRAIVHGTMLYDADPETMTRILTPSAAKLNAKGVKSVRSRITTVREHLDISLEDFRRKAIEAITDSKFDLSPSDIQTIRQMEAEYYRDEWTYGRRQRFGHQRLEGVGTIGADISLKDNKITAIELSGDFFTLAPALRPLTDPLIGVEHTAEAISKALEGVDTSRYIANLTTDRFISLIARQAATT